MGSESTQPNVKTAKTVSGQKKDGTYDITVSATGDKVKKTEKEPLDICFVLDKSGSMNNPLGSPLTGDFYSIRDYREDFWGSNAQRGCVIGGGLHDRTYYYDRLGRYVTGTLYPLRDYYALISPSSGVRNIGEGCVVPAAPGSSETYWYYDPRNGWTEVEGRFVQPTDAYLRGYTRRGWEKSSQSLYGILLNRKKATVPVPGRRYFFFSTLTRWDAAVEAINSMRRGLVDERADARYCIVAFSGNKGNGRWNDAETMSSWRSIQDAFSSNIVVEGGTNYQAGLIQAQGAFGNSASKRILVFISDGNPTFYYDGDGNTVGTGSDSDIDNVDYSLEAARRELYELCDKHAFDAFYTVGVGNPDEYGRLEQLNDVVSQYDGALRPGSSRHIQQAYYEGNDPENLAKAFDDIVDRVLSLSASNVVISDTMSEYGDVTISDDGADSRLEIKDAKGNVWTSPNAGSKPGSNEYPLPIVDEAGNVQTYKGGFATVSVEGKTAKAIFPPEYQLQKGFTYSLVSNFRFNENAFSAFGKGSHSLPTNDRASVTYDVDGKPKSQAPTVKPVTVHNNELKVVLEGLENYRWAIGFLPHGKNDTLDVVYPDGKTTGIVSRPSSYEYEGKDGVFTSTTRDFELFNLPSGTVIGGSKGSFEIWGFKVVESPPEISETNSNSTLTLKETYTPDTVPITVTKEVTGNMADKNRSYGFTLRLDHGGDVPFGTNFINYMKQVNPSSKNGGLVYGHDGTVSFQIRAGQSVTVNVPRGVSYLVSEDAKLALEGYSASYSVNGDSPQTGFSMSKLRSADGPQSITFTNHNDFPVPSGIFLHDGPFCFIAIGGACLVVSMIAINIRRHRARK